MDVLPTLYPSPWNREFIKRFELVKNRVKMTFFWKLYCHHNKQIDKEGHS